MYEAFEPKQSNRWVLDFPKEFGIETWMVNNVTNVVYDAEKREWDDIVITLYDPVAKSASKALSELIEKGGYHNFNMVMTLLGPVGDNVEELYFEKCNFKTIDFGDTNYQKDEFKVVKLLVTFKKCIIS